MLIFRLQNLAIFALSFALFGVYIPAAEAAEKTVNSSNWAGYVTAPGEYDGVGATWVVPSAEDDAPITGHATWVGIGGFDREDLIQAGTLAITDSAGRVYHRAWYELLPEGAITVPLSITPGDTVTVSITEISRDEWRIVIENETTGKTYRRVVDYESSGHTADWIQEMASMGNGMRLPIDNFSPVTFLNAWAMSDGEKVTPKETRAHRVFLTDGKRNTLVNVSKLSKDGDSFTASRTSKKVTLANVNKNYAPISKQNRRIEKFSIEETPAKNGSMFTLRLKWKK